MTMIKQDADASLRIALLSVAKLEILLAFRRAGDLLLPLIFLTMICSLFPLAIGPERNVLVLIGPGVVWVGAILAQLLRAQSLFREDFADGTLELFILCGQPLAALVTLKLLAHWLVSGLPLALMSPVLAATYQLPMSTVPVLVGSLALGTLVLTLLGALGAALTLLSRQSSVLLSLLVLPLSMPVLIFGARAVSLAAQGQSAAAALKLLAALAILGLTLAPLAIAPAIRISNE
ncbi:MAG: heme exporter protein CcmB [Pseudomonadota bacterium]